MEDILKEIAETLKSAYDATNGILVSGDSVDRLAAVRQLLRQAYHTATTPEEGETKDG